ncbi:hypothetical protein [Agrobacterium tumefaciens]|uniref:Uncharacterized protein n=1 Tax=Agrobacterium tumefaciens TaxID=358 RepID=A0A2L2LM53_AGRTU|nr:hypothetical protein [Agrobacterium tumefaciens]AVH45376.1 hypothetical protein At1D1609_53430 [Agrobacterium tumefaciens]NSY99105.1 hypothetical protein [Agrobacterium tumefaciens]
MNADGAGLFVGARYQSNNRQATVPKSFPALKIGSHIRGVLALTESSVAKDKVGFFRDIPRQTQHHPGLCAPKYNN